MLLLSTNCRLSLHESARLSPRQARTQRDDLKAAFRSVCVLFTLLLLFTTRTSAETTVFFPAGGQRGTTLVATSIGEPVDWPLKSWTESSGIQFVPDEKEKGKFQVKLSQDVTPGLHWIRLYSDKAANKLVPFLVSQTPECLESTESAPTDIDLASGSYIANGRLEKNDEVDSYRVRLKKGQTLTAAITANRHLGSPMDAVLQFVDEQNGIVLKQMDDSPALDPIASFTPKADGEYLVRVFAFPEVPTSRVGFAGGTRFVYRLALSTVGIVRSAYPLAVRQSKTQTLEPRGFQLGKGESQRHTVGRSASIRVTKSNTPGFGDALISRLSCYVEESDATDRQPLICSLPCYVSGLIDKPTDRDRIQFDAIKGETVRVAVASRSLDFSLDPVVEVFDANGKSLGKNDDKNGRDAAIDVKIPATGECSIVVSDLHGFGGDDFFYRCRIENVRPDFQLSMDQGKVVAKVGKEVGIKVNITRNDGFNGPIDVTAIRLPEGVFVRGSESQMKQPTEKEVSITLKANKVVSGPFTIVATDGSGRSRYATFAVAGGQTSSDVWLTVQP